MADDKNTANTSPFSEGYQPHSRRERREMEEYFARLAAEKTVAEKAAAEQSAAENAGTEKAAPGRHPRVLLRRPKAIPRAFLSAPARWQLAPRRAPPPQMQPSNSAAATSSAKDAKKSAAAKNAEREESADEESAVDMETTKEFSEMTPKERRKAKRAEQAELTYSQAQEEGRLGEWLWVQAREGGTVILYALVIAFLVKTFLLRGFYIPSGSMEQTLQVNDRVFINVAGSYFSEPKRGDVIVFKDSQGWIPSTQKTSSPLKDVLSFAGILPDTSSNFLVKRGYRYSR